MTISPWVTLLEKRVHLAGQAEPQTFHCITQAPYVGVLALTPDDHVPLVRQFRPCVEDFTLEFPGGTVDGHETPEAAAGRELQEETGLIATQLVPLGKFHPDTGRLDLPSYGFFARTNALPENVVAEAGIELVMVPLKQLNEMIVANEFKTQLHVALYGVALLRGLLTSPC